MMEYYLAMLRFKTAVHFGDASIGNLTDVLPMCHSDTFYSALCSEASSSGLLDQLHKATSSGKVIFSSLLPWYQENQKSEIMLYVPRPSLPHIAKSENEVFDFSEAKEASGERKKIKKQLFVRASDLFSGNQVMAGLPTFGMTSNDVHFNGRTRKPYDLGSYTFVPCAGLYIAIGAADDTDIGWLMRLIYMLGLSGIGGRRSSGYGRFEVLGAEGIDGLQHIEDAFQKLSGNGGDDRAALYKMLVASNAHAQIAMSLLLPTKDETIEASKGYGRMIRRGGFAYSSDMKSPHHTGSVYMMSEGSCFAERLDGRIADVSGGLLPHPVYKYGKGMYLGVKNL